MDAAWCGRVVAGGYSVFLALVSLLSGRRGRLRGEQSTGKGGEAHTCEPPPTDRSLQDWSWRASSAFHRRCLLPWLAATRKKKVARRGRGRPGKCAFLLAFYTGLAGSVANELAKR
ncbi:hypothetical protein HPB50_021005 [Hyalomma asiaticum]|uniref:Uncharacterized protein n=1 Tax=Hyalomma asiaticum TaxID=266040 RepID=A0ACB7T357_HYAAI|nr:hypothetical protein HPB50_021005 [Hyalomma asiaticum]